MSASSKKKLRKEQYTANMTEKQKAAKKEEKKLKIYTAAFWIVLALCVCLVAGMALKSPVTNLVVKATTAAVVGEHKLSAVELNYFYIDAINEHVSEYGDYLGYFGLDTSKPLDEQEYEKGSETTWADAFLDMGLDRAKEIYALYDAAVAAGHKLSDEEQEAIDELYDSMKPTAKTYGFSSVNEYLRAYYGNGANKGSYCDYYEVTALARSYYAAYAEDLEASYTDEDLREYESEKAYEYNSYTYASHYMTVDDFKTGGTKGEDGKITYSDEEIAAAEKAVKEAAEALAIADNNTLEKLNAAIGEMEHAMEEAEAAEKAETAEDAKTDEETKEEEHKHSTCTENDDVLYSSVTSVMQEWLRDEARKEGDITAIPYTTKTTDDDGKEVETLKGYYVVLFQSVNDNTYALKDVRHILISFEGGTTDDKGNTTYSDAEKAAAKAKAEELLEQWKNGDATEDSFAALANEHSTDPGSNTTGGLYEDVYPGQMVTNFNDWCFDEARKVGDTGIVETNYGYHIMFFSADSETNYRDHMITNNMLKEQIEAWQKALNDAMTVTEKNTSHVKRDLVLSNSGNV